MNSYTNITITNAVTKHTKVIMCNSLMFNVNTIWRVMFLISHLYTKYLVVLLLDPPYLNAS